MYWDTELIIVHYLDWLETCCLGISSNVFLPHFFHLIIVTYISTIFKWFAVCLLKWFICTKIQSIFIYNNDHFLPTFNCLTSSTLFSKLSVISSYEYFPQSHCSYIHLVEYDGANNSGKTSQSYAQTLWIMD